MGERLELAPSLAVALVSLGDMSGCASLPDCELKNDDAIVQVEVDDKCSSTRISVLGKPPLGVAVFDVRSRRTCLRGG